MLLNKSVSEIDLIKYLTGHFLKLFILTKNDKKWEENVHLFFNF